MAPARDPVAGSRGASSVALWSFIGTAGFVACLTIVSRSMRAVMDIGGYCAEGGPYEIARRCPDGVPALMIGGMWGGLLFVGVYAFGRSGTGTGSRLLLAWTALFAALGWNFLEYGLAPPEGSGIVWGWLICGILFEAMSGLPLFPFLAFGAARRAWRTARGETLPERPPVFHFLGSRPPEEPAGDPAAGIASALHPHLEDRKREEAPSTGIASELEHLAALHQAGDLTDAEYAAAKALALGAPGEGEQP